MRGAEVTTLVILMIYGIHTATGGPVPTARQYAEYAEYAEYAQDAEYAEYAQAGEKNVRLSCPRAQSDGWDTRQICWYRNNTAPEAGDSNGLLVARSLGPIIHDHNFSMQPKGADLIVKSMTQDRKGTYIAVYRMRRGKDLTCLIKLVLGSRHSWAGVQYATLGDRDVRLSCRPSGYTGGEDVVTILWHHYNTANKPLAAVNIGPIIYNENFKLYNGTTDLVVKEMSRETTGTYTARYAGRGVLPSLCHIQLQLRGTESREDPSALSTSSGLQFTTLAPSTTESSGQQVTTLAPSTTESREDPSALSTSSGLQMFTSAAPTTDGPAGLTIILIVACVAVVMVTGALCLALYIHRRLWAQPVKTTKPKARTDRPTTALNTAAGTSGQSTFEKIPVFTDPQDDPAIEQDELVYADLVHGPHGGTTAVIGSSTHGGTKAVIDSDAHSGMKAVIGSGPRGDTTAVIGAEPTIYSTIVSSNARK